MSELFHKRLRKMGDTKKDAGGNLLCRQCESILTGRQRAYCSDACRDLYYIPRVWSWAVAAVNKRDRGVCQLCGFDTESARKRLREIRIMLQGAQRALHFASEGRRQECQFEINRAYAHHRYFIFEMNQRGYNLRDDTWGLMDGALYEIDHILPVSEGGGGCGIENLRTLCVPCHKRETAELAKRLAEKRRAEKHERQQQEARNRPMTPKQMRLF